MAKLIQRTKIYLSLRILLTIVCSTSIACDSLAESRFSLAADSRLPKWVTLPPGLTRANVSLELSYYSMPWGGRARFILQAKNKQTIEKENGKVRCKEPFRLKSPTQEYPSGYPNYEAVTVNGITEIIEQRKPEPIFYITDDSAVWKQYESIGCG
jgi:hypothetical protein